MKKTSKEKRTFIAISVEPEFHGTVKSIADALYGGNVSEAIRNMVVQSPQWTDREGTPDAVYANFKFVVRALRSINEQHKQIWDLYTDFLEGKVTELRVIPDDNRKS